MVLNYIWIFFFAVAFIVALFRLVIGGDTEVFSAMMTSTFDMSKTGFEISLGLTGVLTLWMGIMKIGERGGAVQVMSGMINPFFRRLFPGLPQDSPAHGSIMMNLAANMLGLDNAATPMGLKAMQQMQEVNTRKDAASNAQIMFLVLNTSGLTIVPVSIMVYRAQLGAANPTDIFIPILLATYFSTLAGLIAVAIYQKINLFDRVILAYLGGISVLMAGVIWYFSTLDKEAVTVVSNVASNIILFGIIMVFIGMAAWKRINVYDAFIEGAKDGFATAVKIIPYLIAILVAIGVFRASGAMEVVMSAITRGIEGLGFNTAEWKRCPGDDDRYHEDFRGRFICRTFGLYFPGGDGYDFLYHCCLFRGGGDPEYPLRCSVWTDCRFSRDYCCGRDRLFVFCLKIFLVQKSVYEKGGCRYERRGR